MIIELLLGAAIGIFFGTVFGLLIVAILKI